MKLMRLRSDLEAHCHAISECWRRRLGSPTVHLVYKALDIASYLDAPPLDRAFGADAFVRWTEKYLKPHLRSDVSARELWLARCRALDPAVDPGSAGLGFDARHLVYCAAGNAREAMLATLAANGLREYVAVALGDLVRAVESGIGAYLAELEEDPDRARRAMWRAAEIFGETKVWLKPPSAKAEPARASRTDLVANVVAKSVTAAAETPALAISSILPGEHFQMAESPQGQSGH